MCGSCGCPGTAPAPGGHDRGGGDPVGGDPVGGDPAGSGPPAPTARTMLLEQRVLARNDGLAEHNRAWLAAREILTVNLMSSPGSGKTTLLERTVRELAGRIAVSVIEGDQETALDSQRLRAAGCRAVQINTGAGCHLDAAMVADGLRRLDPPCRSIVFVENVGNLVCPALFDLGETVRVVICSVTEGADKPLKYPHMFRTADVLVLNKVDLLPYLDVDAAAFDRSVCAVRPRLPVLEVSATRGDGLQGWYRWLARRHGVPGGYDVVSDASGSRRPTQSLAQNTSE
jgi:hydrogenase nickel incorporation protein HypB